VGILSDRSLPSQERLKKVQPLLETMSKAIVEGAQDAPTPEDLLVRAFSSALADQLKPVGEGLSVLLVQMGEEAREGSPARRTYSHVLAPSANQATTKHSPIDKLARRSVGLEP